MLLSQNLSQNSLQFLLPNITKTIELLEKMTKQAQSSMKETGCKKKIEVKSKGEGLKARMEV